MPDKPDKEARRRRRLERRRGAVAEPLPAAGDTAVEESEDDGIEIGQVEEQRAATGSEPAQEEQGGAAVAAAANLSEEATPKGESERRIAEPGATRPFAASVPPRSSSLPFPDILSSARPSPAPRRPGGWTSEPALMALTIVALIILAIDTYFTLRLNGFSDRLSAMASPSSAAPAAATDRPWVGADRITTVAFSSGGQPVTTMHIVNSGRAPALDLRSNTVGSLRSAATPPPDIPKQKGPLATTGILFPNTGGDLTFFKNTRALTTEEAANVQSGKYVLWLAGRLDYKDPAGHAHLTMFRYRYNPQMNAFVAASNGNSAN